MDPSPAVVITQAVQEVSGLAAPVLEQRLRERLGSDWLDAVTANLAKSRRRGSRAADPIEDAPTPGNPAFWLVVLTEEPAVDDVAGAWREDTRELLRLGRRAGSALRREDAENAPGTEDVDIVERLAARFEVFGASTGRPSGYEHPRPLAIRLLATGDLVGAEDANLAWLELDLDDPEAVGHLILVYRAAGRYAEMLDLVPGFEQLLPGDVAPAVAAAHAMLGLERWPQAVDAARIWAGRAPGNIHAWLLMWYAAEQAGDEKATVEALAGWSTATPGDPRAWKYYTGALGETGEGERLTDAALHWILTDPHDPDAKLAYLTGLRLAGQWRAVVDFLEQEWPEGRQIAEAMLAKSYAHRSLGQVAAAAAAVEAATRLPDCPPQAVAEQARVLFDLGDYDAAVDTARRHLDERPDDVLVWQLLARAQDVLGDYEGTLRTADAWLSVAPSPAASTYRVRMLMHLQRWPEARDAAEALQTMSPDDPQAVELLLVTYMNCGESDDTVVELAERLCNLVPDSEFAHRVLEIVQQRLTG